MFTPLYLQILSRAPVYELIFASLSPRSLFRTALTCRAAYLAVAAFKHRAFNINRHLSRFFSDPFAFRSLQAKTSTLISGSNALQFLDRTFYPESDLDLYTHPGHAFEVARFLDESEGYHFVPRDDQEQDWREEIKESWDGTQKRLQTVNQMGGPVTYPLSGINAVYTFQMARSGDQEALTVQIIDALGSPLQVILSFHSTCVMNFITSDSAYSLYPRATFEDRCSLGMPNSRSLIEKVVQKYVRRGWRIYFMPTPFDSANPTKPPFMLDSARWVCDKHTWVLPLDMTGVKERLPLSPASAPLTCDPVRYNGWRLKPPELLLKGYECSYSALQTTIFRYNYVIPDRDEELFRRLRIWANEQARLSHSQLSKADWVWFDADIPSFLAHVC
ncbi:hypothetical protein PAXINDRAFT_114105 [Paxillus involutus ATCC 200175]|uniref:F-box domain-containing protein n=1 Tax=Paxillus involutus ATCC 200175 TaxID=664439 RepID=A0A0C9U8N0_PAXIN|nr:hypothetical protein PAXINDRAFT_114105 [Paxillus involutus ATCC 200175]